ncbi:MAG: hypothetical protein GXP33_10235 [Spirochaetes bacterium]|nr:hypothetical protein [Spirochaetota bacterium]
MKKFKITFIIAVVTLLGGISISAEALNLSADPYRVTIVEIMDVLYNKTIGAQPRFYIVGNDGNLEPLVNLTLPARRRIVLTIVSYDDDNAPLDKRYAKVTGTIDGKVTIIDGAVASGSDTTKVWQKKVSSVPVDKIIHTFTIPALNINIPIIAGTTEITSLYLNTAGTYTWSCKTACGSDPDGWGGAMAASGWMKGTVNVVAEK